MDWLQDSTDTNRTVRTLSSTIISFSHLTYCLSYVNTELLHLACLPSIYERLALQPITGKEHISHLISVVDALLHPLTPDVIPS